MSVTVSLAPPVPELETLVGVGQVIADAPDLAAAVHGIIPLLDRALGVRRGSFAPIDPNTGVVKGWIAHGFEDETILHRHHVLADRLAQQVVATGELVVVEDVLAPPAWYDHAPVACAPEETPLAVLSAPVFVEGAVGGALSVEMDRADPEALAGVGHVLRVAATMFGHAVRLHTTVADLEEARSEAEAILASMPNAVVTMDLSGRILSLNAAAGRMLGVRSDHAVYRPYGTALGSHRGLVRVIDSILAADPGQSSTDLTIFPPDGPPIPASLVWSWLRDRAGEVRGIIVTLQDRSELRRLERQVHRAQRLAALGTMAAGIAHEVRNPLAGIRGAAQLARKRVGDDERLQTYVDLIHTESERLDAIVEQLVRFARPQKAQRHPASLREVAEHALSLVRPQAGEAHVECSLHEPEAVPQVRVDSHQLTQVFLNLFLNAIQAMPDGGALTVRVLTDSGPQPGQRMAVVEVQDCGCGMDRQTQDKLFTPFFTTKPTGTGLGLAIAHRIMEEHGGGLDVISLPGEGATFYVSVPMEAAG